MMVGVLSTAEASLCVGIVMLMLATIWGFLFLCPKSPVKKYWWSIPDKLMFVIPKEPGYKATVHSEYVSVWVDLTSQSGIMVDRIAIKIGRKRIYSFEWKSHEVAAHEHKFLDFKRPDWLGTGKYEAKLIAYTTEGYSQSRKFILENQP
ncbi:MAG TPA: hypothetical protein VMW64_00805 [Dehalococcoidia bacterium]|nr:hypothetical protein [Dehalococcoidia bacterium]